MALGCDTSVTITAARLQSLVSDKYTFVGRYLGGSYAMSQAEAKRISAGGLYIVSNERLQAGLGGMSPIEYRESLPKVA